MCAAKSEVPLSAETVADRTSLVLPYVEAWLENQTLAGFVSRIGADENDPSLYFLSEAQRQVLFYSCTRVQYTCTSNLYSYSTSMRVRNCTIVPVPIVNK